MGKCGMEMGYSEKSVFLMKGQVMDQLVIRLGGIRNV